MFFINCHIAANVNAGSIANWKMDVSLSDVASCVSSNEDFSQIIISSSLIRLRPALRLITD